MWKNKRKGNPVGATRQPIHQGGARAPKELPLGQHIVTARCVLFSVCSPTA